MEGTSPETVSLYVLRGDVRLKLKPSPHFNTGFSELREEFPDDPKLGREMERLAPDVAEFTKALDLQMTHPGPPSVGIVGRSKRFALYVTKGEVKYMAVSEGPDDPAGDADPSASLADAMLKAIKA